MGWSPVYKKHKKPLGWWYHKFMCELFYHLQGGSDKYYYHLNKMIDDYGFNLYGDKIK